jgi:hypothetical protein
MKYVFKGEKPILVPELGRVKPGQEFDVNNEKLLPIFEALFEKVEDKPKVKKVKKDEEGE